MFRPSNPETIERRAAARKVERMDAKASRIERLRTLAERDGRDSIWAELLALELTPASALELEPELC